MIPVFNHPVHGPIRLGKHPVTAKRHEINRRLAIGQFLPKAVVIPETAGYWEKVQNDLNILGNDQYGDCVEAAGLHLLQRVTAYANIQVVPSTADALAAYTAVTGFNPNDPSTDQGTDPFAFLTYWQKTGLTIGGKLHKIVAFASVNPSNQDHIQLGIDWFGGVFTGLQLPVYAQNRMTGGNGRPLWQYPGDMNGDNAPGSWGGHMVDMVGGSLAKGKVGTLIDTWATLYDMTFEFIKQYSDEMWVIVTQDWLEQDKQSPSGFDLPGLLKNLREVTC